MAFHRFVLHWFNKITFTQRGKKKQCWAFRSLCRPDPWLLTKRLLCCNIFLRMNVLFLISRRLKYKISFPSIDLPNYEYYILNPLSESKRTNLTQLHQMHFYKQEKTCRLLKVPSGIINMVTHIATQLKMNNSSGRFQWYPRGFCRFSNVISLGYQIFVSSSTCRYSGRRGLTRNSLKDNYENLGVFLFI